MDIDAERARQAATVAALRRHLDGGKLTDAERTDAAELLAGLAELVTDAHANRVVPYNLAVATLLARKQGAAA